MGGIDIATGMEEARCGHQVFCHALGREAAHEALPVHGSVVGAADSLHETWNRNDFHRFTADKDYLHLSTSNSLACWEGLNFQNAYIGMAMCTVVGYSGFST